MLDQPEQAAQKLIQKLGRGRMANYLSATRSAPSVQAAKQRIKNFKEIYAPFEENAAGVQASRCTQCGVPFCQIACPLHNNIPDWLLLAAAGRWHEAYLASSLTNIFPEICGRICPQDRLCEGSCVMEQSQHGAITIGSIETYITELAWQKGWVQQLPNKQAIIGRVAVVGSGPAGLSAATVLAANGVAVTVYEAQDRAGGLLVYGIPDFKLDKRTVARRINQLTAAGVKFVYNCRIGQDLSFQELREQNDAVYLAPGVYAARASGCDWPKAGVLAALPYLIASNRRNNGEQLAPSLEAATNLAGRKVMVIGGGDTAIDCVRTAIRQGASEVNCIYRRTRANMPGSQREYEHARAEGVKFSWLRSPAIYLTNSKQKLTAVKLQLMLLARGELTDRAKVYPNKGVFETMKTDVVIEALGFQPENLAQLFASPELVCDAAGRIRCPISASLFGHSEPTNGKDWQAVANDAMPVTATGALLNTGESYQTSLANVYAGGDIVRGASLVVWAIRDGMLAGQEMVAAIKAKAYTAPPAPSKQVELRPTS